MANYEKILKKMIKEKKSIRDISKEFNISKSVLHRNLHKALLNVDNSTKIDFKNLMLENKNNMREKRWQNKYEQNKRTKN